MRAKKFGGINLIYYLCKQKRKITRKQIIIRNLKRNNMTQITIIKKTKGKDTLILKTIEELAEQIRQGEYAELVQRLRNHFPLFDGTRSVDGELEGFEEYTKGLPRILFALEQKKHDEQRVTLSYTGLVLLEVNNLTGREEAEAIRQGAAELPQTLMAFVGADGQSVKIVCRGELPKGLEVRSEGLEDSFALFHENLYERARLIYNGQLGVTIEKLEPRTTRICYMSSDAGVYYNPDAASIFAKAEKPTELTLRRATKQPLSDDHDQYISMHTAYEFNMTKALDETTGIDDEDLRRHSVLTLLAQYCLETGIPMGVAQHLTRLRSWLNSDPMLVNKTFENVYRDEHLLKMATKRGITLTRHMSPEALLTMKINTFLTENYDLRKNVMRGVAEYRPRTGIGFSYQDLTEEARNSITMRALEQGIRCWDKDIRRFVNSEDITPYDPINEWLERLPQWDGKDRVTPLAQRIPTDNEAWPHLFHLWMRSMVAMWLGKGQLTGNALVPLLIGRQGCGKSSFCRILMPREVMDYYNDRINFKNESDLNLGLTSFALINLDEFDKITQRQQIVLKYLLSTADLKYRPPYGKAYSQHRRYASFIGTTNETHPLTDPTGSRRFICTLITGDIDFQTPVDHSQLYAQLKQEIAQGQRYWLTKDEEHQLMEHNLVFQQLSGLAEMLMSVIQKPHDGEGEWMTLKDLSALLKSHFKGYKEEASTFQKIGGILSRPEYKFESRRTTEGMLYLVQKR